MKAALHLKNHAPLNLKECSLSNTAADLFFSLCGVKTVAVLVSPFAMEWPLIKQSSVLTKCVYWFNQNWPPSPRSIPFTARFMQFWLPKSRQTCYMSDCKAWKKYHVIQGRNILFWNLQLKGPCSIIIQFQRHYIGSWQLSPACLQRCTVTMPHVSFGSGCHMAVM